MVDPDAYFYGVWPETEERQPATRPSNVDAYLRDIKKDERRLAQKSQSENVRALRKALGMSQEALARKLDVSLKTIVRAERQDGTLSLKLIFLLERLCQICDLPDMARRFTDLSHIAPPDQISYQPEDHPTAAQATRHKVKQQSSALTLTPLEVAHLCGFGVRATYEMLHSGMLPSIRVGTRFFIPRNALERWLESSGEMPKQPQESPSIARPIPAAASITAPRAPITSPSVFPDTVHPAPASALPIPKRVDHKPLKSQSESTVRNYRTSWEKFSGWCKANDFESLPAPPDVVALFAIEHGQSHSKSTVMTWVSAIEAKHRETDPAHFPFSRTQIFIKEALPRLVNDNVDSAMPLSKSDVLNMLAVIDRATLIGLRDLAIITLGFWGGLSRSELVELDVEDVIFQTDKLLIRVDGQYSGIVDIQAEGLGSTKRALHGWISALDSSKYALFRSINRHGQIRARLSDKSVAKIVQKYAKLAGIRGENISGESLRIGTAVHMSRMGTPESVIVAYLRRRNMMRVFSNQIKAARGNLQQHPIAS